MKINNESIKCPECGEVMSPIYFTEEEEIYDKDVKAYYKSGRKRSNVSHFECRNCDNKQLVDDDTFAGEWR